MQYNKNKFNKVNDKKVMKKVKKQWVVVSVATLAILGASAYSMTSTQPVVAHADGQTTTNSGNSGESQSQQGSSQNSGASDDTTALKSSAASQGSLDGTAGAAQKTVSSAFQNDYNAAYSAASTAASTAAYNAGSSDFSNGSHNSSYANHQSAYDAGYNAASSTAASIASSIASSNAASAGLNDYLAGSSKASSASNNDVYSKAYDSASAGFSSAASANVVPAVTGSSNVSQSNADSAVQAGINAESTYQQDMTNAANDAYNGVNNSSKLTGSHQSIYSAAYAGAQSVMNSYAQMTNGKGTGTQDYNYYANTAGSGANTVPNASQSVSSPNGSGNGNTAGVTDANAGGSTTAVQSSYYAPSSNSYTANVSTNTNSNLGGADDPTSAHTSVVNYDNDLGKKFNNQYYASIKDHSNIQIPTENSITNNYVGANGAAFKYGVEYALAKLGINDAETGKWVGVDSSQNKGNSNTQTFDFFTQQYPNALNDTSNIYAQAYLGAKQAIQNQFNSSSQIQTISSLNDNTKTAWYQSGYSDVQNQANQGVAFISNGNQFNNILTGTTTGTGGTSNTSYNVLKMVNDINASFGSGGKNGVTNDSLSKSLYIDGQNHLIDTGEDNFNFSTTRDIHIQNFSAIYGDNYWGPFSHSSTGAIYFQNVNYIGFQMLSATQNDVYIDGSVNAFQRDKYFVSPFGSYTWYDRAQNVLSINNMILGANAHFYGSTGYLAGQSVIALSGNLTLGNNSNMTLVPRGYSIGGDDNGGSGPEGLYMNSGSVLNVNNNAVLNVIPDWGTSSTSYGAGGIYVGTNSTINVNGGKINLESNQAPATYGYNDVLLFVDSGGSINVTNGGLVQVKSNGLGTNSSYALVYLPYGNINVANQGNFIVTIPDASGKGVDLINGTLNVVDSGQSHVILDRGNSNNSFVYNGSINAYTAKVSDGSGKSTIYYKYNVNSSNGITSLDQYLNPNPSGATVSGNHIELESVPSVYFAGPIHAKNNYDNNHNLTSITVSGYSKVTDNPNNQLIYIQYSTSTDGSSSLTNNYVVNQNSGYVYDPTTTQGSNQQRIDNTPYSGTLSGNNNQSLIPFSFTVNANTLSSANQNVAGTSQSSTQSLGSINKVGVYLKYGVNGIYMTTTPTDSGNGDYQIYIDGFNNSGANGSLSSLTSPASQIALDSGSGAKIDSGIAAANKDAGGANPLQRDITLYQKDQAYTNAYNSAQSGYSAISGLTADQLKQILGPNFNIANAPTSLTQDQLNALKNTDAYKGSSNPDAFISGAQQAYTDLLAGKDAANALNNNSVTPATVANDASKTNNYKSNFNVAYSVAQAALNDAKTGKNNVPSDATQAQIYNAAQAQFSSAKAAFESGNPTINANDDDATKAGKTAYQQVLSDIQNGVDSSSPNSGYNSLTPLQKAIYDAEYADAKKQYDAGENAALKGGKKPTSGIALQAYTAAAQGFNGANKDDNGNSLSSDVINSKAYKDGQTAKTNAQDGYNAAYADTSINTDPSNDSAKNQAIQATKDAYAAVENGNTSPADTTKPLAYQYAYNKALDSAQRQVQQAQNDYKNGTNSTQSGNGQDAKAYNDTVAQAQQGAQAANTTGSSATLDANQSPAYKMGYNIAKGTADAEAGQTSQQPDNSDYQTAFANFNSAKALGEQNRALPANPDQATKDGFAYGQGISDFKNAKNPDAVTGLTGKTAEGYADAKAGYDEAMSGQTKAPTSPAAAVEGYNYAKALIQGAQANTEPSDDSTQKAAYDDTQAAIAQAKKDVKAGNPIAPSDGNANNKDVYDKAYAAAVKAYNNTDPNATAASAGFSQDAVGTAAFNAAKADGLKVQGAKEFTDGKANNQSDSNFTKGYNDAKQGYKDALKGTATDSASSTDAYNTGASAGANDRAGFQSAENGNPDGSDTAKGAAAAIAAVRAVKGNLDSLSEINDSSEPAAYNNAYNVALEDAKQAAKQGIASQSDPNSSDGQASAPTAAALADVYKAAANDAQKGYAEGLTGKTVSDSNNSSETQGNQKGAADKAKYEAAVRDYANANGDVNAAKTADPTNASDPVYQKTLNALDDASKGNTPTDSDIKSPVYAVAYSQASAKKAAMNAINDANKVANGNDPQQITDANVPVNVPDKQSFIDAYNNAIAGYNAGKRNSNDTDPFTDPADQQAFNDAKAAGQAARGANDLLNGVTTAKSVDGTTNDSSYIAGVDDASAGYTDGLNGTKNASADVQATPAYQKAYAQGQADKAGVDAAKSQATPDANDLPSSLNNATDAAKNAYKGYADAIAAVKAAKGTANVAGPSKDQSSDYKAAYQKALQDAIAANKAGQDSITTPSSAAARPSEAALAAVYDAAQHDTNKGMAEALSGKTVSDSSNANEQAGHDAGNKLKAAYQAAAKDFANRITDPAKATQTFSDSTQEQAYRDALAGMVDGSQTPATDTNDPKDGSPIYAIAKQQAQNVKNAVAAAQGSQNVANGQPNKDADLANASGYGNDDNKSDMNDAYTAAANAYSDAINHSNGDQPTDQSQYGPAAQMAYAQAYNAAKAAAAKGLTDFGNGNKTQEPSNLDLADKAAYDKAQNDALTGLNDGLANHADATKQANNPAYKQGVDDAAAIQKAAEDAVNGTPDAGKASLATDAQKAAYDNIKDAAIAGQSEYTSNPDNYSGKTGDDLKNDANQAAQAKYPNDALKQAAFVQAIEAAGDAFGNGANAFGNGEQQPSGISAAGYQAAQQAYNAATNGEPKPDKVNGHYPTPEGVTPSDQYDKTFDAAYNKYKTAADKAAQDTAANGGTAANAANSNDYKTATSMEQDAYNAAATKTAQGIAAAKLADPTKDAQYGTTSNGTFVPNTDTAAQAYAGAKAGYADGKTGVTNEPTNVSAAYKAAYDKANADAKAAAHAGVEDFAQGLSAANPTEDAQATKNAHSNGYNQASAGYQAAINNPSGDFSSNSDASYQKGVKMAKAAAAARDNIVNNGDNAQATQGETSSDPDVQGAAKAAAAAAKAALADGKDGKKLVNGPADVPAEFKPYAQIYADAYANVQNAAVQAAQEGAKAFASDGTEGNHNIKPNDKSVAAVANQEGYKDAQTGYQDAQNNPDSASSNPNTGSVNGDEAAKGAAAAFNDVAGKDNAKPGDHATSDNNPVYEAAYQKALAEGKGNAADGAEALFNNNSNNSTANAATLAKPNATTAAEKAFNKGLDDAKTALSDAQANDPAKDAQYNGDNANTDAGNVYHATQDAYNAVLNGQQPLTDSALAAGDPVYAAAYKNALSRAQTASTNGATDTADNGSSYAPNALAQAVYEKARSGASQAYRDALKNTDPSLAHHNGIDKASVAYQATQNAINDYLKNNGNSKEDPTAAGIDSANAQAYRAYYEKAEADVTQAATNGVNAYLGGTAIDDVPSVEGDNAGLGQVAKEAAQRAEKGHEDAVNNGGIVSDANKPISKDSAYLTGLKGAQDAAKGVDEAKADSTQQPATSAPQSEQDGFNGTVDGYNKAATDGSIKPADIDSYIADHLSNKSIAYRDAFKDAYLDGLNVAKAGADAANANQPNATKDQKGAAQKAQTQAYNDATNAFQDKLHGVEDNDVTSNTPAAEAGRQRASQYALALQDVADGHPNTGSTDADYQKGLATAQAAVAQAVADAKANKQLPADPTQIPVPDGSDPVAYRDAYAGILSGFYNGYNSKSTESGSQDAYYNVAFGIGFAKGKASIPTDTSAPLDFWKNKKAPKITDPAVAKAYKDQYVQAKAGFYDALYNKGDKSNNEYYKGSYKTAKDGLAGMKLAAKGDTKQNRNILKTKDAAFVSGYNGYLKGIEAAKRTLKKNKKLSAKDLLNKDKLYSYTFKEGLKHEVKVQRSHGKKAGVNKALERHAIPKDIYTHHSATYARTFIATYKKEMKRHMPRYIYNVGTIFTHNHVKFTNHTRIREYAYSARYNSTVFKVVGVKYYKNRIPRYRLSNGAVVTASQEVQNAYYKNNFKKYSVINPNGVLIHTGKKFTESNSVRRLYRGEVFHVSKVVKFHGITRLYVGKNEYITSNKTFVEAVNK